MDKRMLHIEMIYYASVSKLWHITTKSSDYIKTHQDDLALKITDAEIKILSSFGLPHIFKYTKILHYLGLINELKLSEINACIHSLEVVAKMYFSENPLTDIELLKRAQEYKEEIDNVLPELSLKLQPEPYYWYCYYNQLLKNKTTPELFLKELKFVEANNCSMQIYRLGKKLTDYKKDKMYHKLSQYNLKFLDSYLEAEYIYHLLINSSK